MIDYQQILRRWVVTRPTQRRVHSPLSFDQSYMALGMYR
ncbi:MAG: hypothetical protein QOF66_7615 [Mycobacterium sp.]|jgi:hypothetical protein|nr:hypothetical protein [Mycobacterium sp.]